MIGAAAKSVVSRIYQCYIFKGTCLKGQYHAIFSNTLKIEKTLFG